jgi:hypothetical protein
MIHYINGVPASNIKLTKTKRHALAHYRHVQLINTVKDIAIRSAITLTVTTILAVTYLLATN